MALSPQLKSGHAALHVGVVHDRSVALSSWSRSPLRLLSPRVNHSGVWAYTSTFGGGLVAGDCTHMDVQVDPGARCFLGTQSSTKVYRNCASLPCSHRVTATLADDSLLIIAPDPVQPFADSIYDQVQRFDLTPSASLVLVDSVCGGRTALGERWSFQRYSSRIDVVRETRLLLSDRIRLEPASKSQHFATGRFNCFATVFLLGPKVAGHARAIHDVIAAEPISRVASVVAAASPLHEGVLVRIGGVRSDEVRHRVHQHLRFVNELLHDDPFARKW